LIILNKHNFDEKKLLENKEMKNNAIKYLSNILDTNTNLVEVNAFNIFCKYISSFSFSQERGNNPNLPGIKDGTRI
jgi:hypothetical protein